LIPYSSLPGLVQWAKDSCSPNYAKDRKSDPVIFRIDQLVSFLPRTTDDGQKKYLLSELFFATNFWLRNPPDAKEVRKPGWDRLEAAVKALRDVVQRTLAAAFQCAYGMVPDVLSRYYGCPLTAHGIYVDDKHVVQKADYERFKVHFRKGIALQFNWRDSKDLELRPVNTKDMVASTKPTLEEKGYAFFVLTRYRDLYVAPFSTTCPLFPRYHSTIPEKTAVQCAGSILIENGVVKGICNDSGHYSPGDLYFVNVLEQLKTMEVPIKGISLANYEGDSVAEDAEEYLNAHGNWDEIKKRKELNRQRLGEEGGAARALRYKARLELLKKNHSEDQALEMLFAEEFGRRNQGGQGGVQLWTETWKGILDALLALAQDLKGEEGPLRVLVSRKIAQYKLRPPVPPRPRNLKKLTYV
jgi:hypothetical protein